MKKTFLLCILVSILFINCGEKNDDDPIPTPAIYTQLDVVTGIRLSDEHGNPLGHWKSPNDKPGQSFVYPNPNVGVVSVYSPLNIKRIWLIPTNCMLDSMTADIPTLSQNLNYEISALEMAQIKDIALDSPNSNIHLNLSDVPAGFYKLFYQLETDDIFWQNIYTDPLASPPLSHEDLDTACP